MLKPEVASSDPGINPNATLGPEASLDSTVAEWKDQDSTNAPNVGQPDEQPSSAASYPALLEKFLQDKIQLNNRTVSSILVIGWFGFLSWLFVQDNGSGALATWSGLKWFLAKAGLYTAVFVIVIGAFAGLRWLTKPRTTPA